MRPVYADDTSLYSHFNVKELDSRAVDINETLVSITYWSQDPNLALNLHENMELGGNTLNNGGL